MKRPGLKLVGLFVLALPVFMWSQWSPAVFVQQRLAAAGLDQVLRFDRIDTTWRPGLHVQGIQAQLTGGVDVHVEDVWLSPAWLQLLQAKPGVYVCGESRRQPFSLTLLSADDGAVLRDIDVAVDSAQLKDHVRDIAMGMDVYPQGMLRLHGGMGVAKTGVPTWADVRLTWEHAQLAMGAQQVHELGDFSFTLVSSDDAWRWTLNGGEGLAVSGSGVLQPAGANLESWGVQGSLKVEAEGMIGDMLTMVSGGAKHATALLSGTLANPRIQWRK